MIMFTKKSLLLSYSLKLEPTDSLHSIFNGKLKKTINSRKPLLSSIDHRSLTKNSAKYQGIFRKDREKTNDRVTVLSTVTTGRINDWFSITSPPWIRSTLSLLLLYLPSLSLASLYSFLRFYSRTSGTGGFFFSRIREKTVVSGKSRHLYPGHLPDLLRGGPF